MLGRQLVTPNQYGGILRFESISMMFRDPKTVFFCPCLTQRYTDSTSCFLPARRSAGAVFATETCLSVTRRYCIETDKDIIKLFLGLVAPPHRFSNTAHDCEILTGRGACHSGGRRKRLTMALLESKRPLTVILPLGMLCS